VFDIQVQGGNSRKQQCLILKGIGHLSHNTRGSTIVPSPTPSFPTNERQKPFPCPSAQDPFAVSGKSVPSPSTLSQHRVRLNLEILLGESMDGGPEGMLGPGPPHIVRYSIGCRTCCEKPGKNQRLIQVPQPKPCESPPNCRTQRKEEAKWGNRKYSRLASRQENRVSDSTLIKIK